MIEDFLRPPASVAEWFADAIRAIGVLSVLAAAVWWSMTDAGILALALPALLAPRFAGTRPTLDAGFGALVLIAAWSNVLDLYTTIPGWDLAVHFAATGAIATVLFVILARLQVVETGMRARVPLVLIPALGLALSALWEMVEWAGKTFITDEIFVTYQDTIGDMAFGGLGALSAGWIATRVRLVRIRTRIHPAANEEGPDHWRE
jgi:hypothetical protein